MGHVYLYTGKGGGKTTNALGLALRSVGHKRKVIIIQFLKYWKNTGEYKIRKKLKPWYEIYQFGRPGWFEKRSDKKIYKFGKMKFRVRILSELDRMLAEKAIDFAERITKKKKPNLLILDEINLAIHWGLLKVGRVINFLDKLPKKTDVVLTGRYAPKELIARADFVNEIKEIKTPKEFKPTRGIQY